MTAWLPALGLGLIILLVFAVFLLVVIIGAALAFVRKWLPFFQLLSVIPQCASALRQTALALNRSSEGLGWVKGNLNEGGERLEDAATGLGAFSIKSFTFEKAELPGGTPFVKRVDEQDIYPLLPLSAPLAEVGHDLKGRTNQNLTSVQNDMSAAADSLNALAQILETLPT